MARVLCILALVGLIAVVAVMAQQQVQCTYNLAKITSSNRNRYVSAGGAVSTTIPTSITNRPTSVGNGCWQLDGLGSVSPALEPQEQPSPSSPTILVSGTGGAAVTSSNAVCSTNNSIFGNTRELQLSANPDNCILTEGVFSRTSDGGQGQLALDSTNGCDYTATYRLDGSANCGTTTYTTSFNLATAAGKSLNALGDSFEVTFGSDGGSVPTVYVTINVYGSSAAEVATVKFPIQKSTNTIQLANNYIIPFSSFSGSNSVFSNTGAIELISGGADTNSLMLFFDVIQSPSTSVSATVFVDCGCNGFQAGSGDSLQSGVAVALAVSGSGCTASSQSQTTSSAGTVSFTNLPAGCTYTLSVAGQNLCSTSSSSQNVAAGGSASFAIQGAGGVFTIPSDKTVTCGADTSPTVAGTGVATGGSGTCGTTGTPTSSDVVTPQTCTAPGGTLSIIKRTWSLAGQASQTQTITVVDSRQITLTGVPSSTTLACNAPIPTAQVTGVACTAVTVVPTTSNNAGTCDTTTCTSSNTAVVTYTGTDVCKNTVTRTVTYTRPACTTTCPPPPPPPNTPNPPPPPPATQLPTNANCRFICDDDDSSAVTLIASIAVAFVLALAAAF
jgi:hypothetical protein